MSAEAPKPVEETKVETPAAATETPAAPAVAAAEEPAKEEEPKKEEAKEEPKVVPATDGVLGYKSPSLFK
jgi:ribosomal protein L12E/L44/L45/RPP1/RPP2